MGSGLFFLFFYNKMPSNRAAEEISATPEDVDYHSNVDDVKVMSILINYLCFNFLVWRADWRLDRVMHKINS